MQLGSSNALETLVLSTSSVPGTIKSITVDWYGTAHELSVSVGGTAYTMTNTDGNIYTGAGASSGEIEISILKGM